MFTVPTDGVYYIGYYLEVYNWTCKITKSNIEQTLIEVEAEPIGLPYNVDHDAENPYEGWAFPGATDENPWGFDADANALKGSAADMWFFTPCFNGSHGYFTVTYHSTAPVKAAVYTVADKDADPVGLADYNKDKIFVNLDATVGGIVAYSVNDDNTATAKIPNYDQQEGVNPYYIGFHIENADAAEHTFKLLSLEQHSDDVTGIENVVVVADEAVYFDLQGNRIANPESGRIYIRIAGSRSEKVRF